MPGSGTSTMDVLKMACVRSYKLYNGRLLIAKDCNVLVDNQLTTNTAAPCTSFSVVSVALGHLLQ